MSQNKREELRKEITALIRDARVFTHKELVRQLVDIAYSADRETASIHLQLKQLKDIDRMRNPYKYTKTGEKK